MRKESLAFLKELLSTPTLSGNETAGQRLWCDYARQFADEVITDAYGNAVAILNPGGSPKIMLDGHVDEIGLMVKHIDDKGFLYVQNVGGVDAAQLRGKRLDIHGGKGIVRGIVGATAIHLQDREKDQKAPKIHEIHIDIGAADGKEARKRVAVGDPVTFVEGFEMMTDHVAVARAFDNRAGTWAVIEALRLAKDEGVKCCLCACSSIQEETGLNGAKMQVFNVKPDLAIAVDVTHATDTPGIDVKQHGEVKMGKGPTLSLGRENHPRIIDRLRKVARKREIEIQEETFSTRGGTDAYAIWTANGGVPSTILSIPNRYMHSTVEMLDLRDLENVSKLLAAFCVDLKKGEKFAVKV